MKRRACTWCGAAVLAAAAVAAMAQAPASRPASKTRAAIDYVKDLFDNYYQGAERDRFFLAAGVDGQVTREEFAAAGKQAGSFVRPYDRWSAAAVFDRDANRKLNWVEAELYRLAIRARVLRLFDKDKDGRLTGAERDAANLYLATGMGKARPVPATAPRTAPPPEAREDADVWPAEPAASPADSAPRWWQDRWRQISARFDRDRDGKLDDDERLRMERSLRWHQRRRLMMRFDTNRDGRLDPTESAAVELAERQEAQALRQRWELAEWDADGNGALDPPERRALEADLDRRRAEAAERHTRWVSLWDRDGDGAVSPAERAAATENLRQRVAKQRKEMDTDSDGKITADEIRAYRKKLFNRTREEPVARDGGK